MEKGYKNIVYFFVVISVILFIGFYKSFLVYFPHSLLSKPSIIFMLLP